MIGKLSDDHMEAIAKKQIAPHGALQTLIWHTGSATRIFETRVLCLD